MKPFWPQTTEHTAQSSWAQQCLTGHPASCQWMHRVSDTGMPSHSCAVGVSPCVSSHHAHQIPVWCRAYITDTQSSVYELKLIPPQETEQHIVWHLQGCILTPRWRNRNTEIVTPEAHFSTRYPSSHICTIYIGENSSFQCRNCCVFGANLYKLASVILHSFLQNMPQLLSCSWQFVSII